MKYEKSCGAVIWRNNGGRREYLLILNKKGNACGHWGFPKGHVEADETEQETAKREIFEETGIRISSFAENFRTVSSYNPLPDVNKDVVYFLAEVDSDCVELQQSEVADYKWLDFYSAKAQMSFDTSIIEKAEEYLCSN